jgi:hypothetical protein
MKNSLRQSNQQRQRMSRRTIAVIAASSIAALVVVFFFLFNIGNIRHSLAGTSKKVFTSQRDGDFFSPSTWSGGSVPSSWASDSIVILNNVTFNSSFTTGDGSTKTGIYIASGKSLKGTGTLTLAKYATVYNAGTLSLGGLTFNVSGSDAASYFTNTGTATVSSAVNEWGTNTVLTNSGTLSITGSSKIDGIVSNTGTLTVTGNFDSDNGTITNSKTGTVTITGTSTMSGARIINSTTQNTYKVDGQLTLNTGSTIANTGNFTIGTSTASASLIINDGQLTNNKGGHFQTYGILTLNAGSGNNKITNYGNVSISQSVTTYNTSVISNTDTLSVGTDFTNGSAFTNSQYGYVNVVRDMQQNATFTNNAGYVKVGRNFTNSSSAIYTGTGGGLSIAAVSTNNGTISGSTDVCDATKTNGKIVDNNTGTIGTNITTCQYTYNPPTALPVELTAFSASRKGDEVVLNWHTMSEIDNDRFEVQRSTDGVNYETINTVKGHGTTETPEDYTYTDNFSQQGATYYRLKQVDYNGTSQLSPIAVVHNGNATEQAAELNVNIYPNPVQNGSTLHVQIDAPKAEQATFAMMDMTGATALTENANLQSGKNTQDISINNLREGMYILRIDYNGATTTKKIQVRR